MTLTLHDICHVENTLEPILSSDEVRSSIDVLIPDVTGRKSVKSYNCAW